MYVDETIQSPIGTGFKGGGGGRVGGGSAAVSAEGMRHERTAHPFTSGPQEPTKPCPRWLWNNMVV